MKMEQSVPRRRHINFRRRGITQKKAYNNLIITCKCESVALVIQHAMRMCQLCFLLWPLSLQYLPTLSHIRHDFRTNVHEHNTCVLIFSTTVFGNIFHS